MFSPPEILSHVVLVSPKAEIAVTSANLVGEHTVDSPGEEAQLLKALLLARSSCTFIPADASITGGSVLLLFSRGNRTLHIQMVVVNQDGTVVDFKSSTVPKIQDSVVCQVSCSPSGYMSVLSECTHLFLSLALLTIYVQLAPGCGRLSKFPHRTVHLL